MLTPYPTPRSAQGGLVLLEGLLAAVVFSLGILGIISLQANLMKLTTTSKDRIDASLIANQKIAESWLSPAGIADSSEAISTLPNGTVTQTVSGREVTVTVSWQSPGQSATQSFTTTATINSALQN